MNEPARGRSVRFRLLAIALLPMLVILPLLLGVAIYRWNARFDSTLISTGGASARPPLARTRAWFTPPRRSRSASFWRALGA